MKITDKWDYIYIPGILIVILLAIAGLGRLVLSWLG